MSHKAHPEWPKKKVVDRDSKRKRNQKRRQKEDQAKRTHRNLLKARRGEAI